MDKCVVELSVGTCGPSEVFVLNSSWEKAIGCGTSYCVRSPANLADIKYGHAFRNRLTRACERIKDTHCWSWMSSSDWLSGKELPPDKDTPMVTGAILGVGENCRPEYRISQLTLDLAMKLPAYNHASLVWSSTGMKWQGKREIPEKTRRPAASPGTIPACGNPVANSLGVKPGSTGEGDDEALGVRVSVARIAPSLLELGRAAPSRSYDFMINRSVVHDCRSPLSITHRADLGQDKSHGRQLSKRTSRRLMRGGLSCRNTLHKSWPCPRGGLFATPPLQPITFLLLYSAVCPAQVSGGHQRDGTLFVNQYAATYLSPDSLAKWEPFAADGSQSVSGYALFRETAAQSHNSRPAGKQTSNPVPSRSEIKLATHSDRRQRRESCGSETQMRRSETNRVGGPQWCSGYSSLHPPRQTRFDSRWGCPRIFVSGNRTGRCCWLAGFLGDLPFSPPFHSGTALCSYLETSKIRVII
ncbi:hypothetical protein PR048_007267 [Dryococelus australis]|uniref:Uncharacterized protein n=1 Tax=Dryococelus australis TaxID=614101 RepID=A0ABQ9ID57_9NEOP|nr:hypothetical protein PR048_007267 [Dryococelus australis]